MIWHRSLPVLLSALVSSGLGCGDDATPADAGQPDAFEDAAADAAVDTDAEARSDAGHAEAYGFALRIPQSRTIPCVGEGGFCSSGTIEFPDRDYVCTLQYQSLDEYVYVQATPTEFVGFIGPTFETVGAWRSDGQTATAVTASYDWGGGHHNEAIVLDLPERRFQYWHSSFGFGFRACHAPDCLDVYEPGTANLVEQGCSRERRLPVVCVLVSETGQLPALVDTFQRCLRDD